MLYYIFPLANHQKKNANNLLIQQCICTSLLRGEIALSDLNNYCESYFFFCQRNKSFSDVFIVLHHLVWYEVPPSFPSTLNVAAEEFIWSWGMGKSQEGGCSLQCQQGVQDGSQEGRQDAGGRTPCPAQRWLDVGCFQLQPRKGKRELQLVKIENSNIFCRKYSNIFCIIFYRV